MDTGKGDMQMEIKVFVMLKLIANVSDVLNKYLVLKLPLYHSNG